MSEQAKIGRKGSKHNENEEEGSGNAVNAYFVLLRWKLLVAPLLISSVEVSVSYPAL